MSAELVLNRAFYIGEILEDSSLHPVGKVFPATCFFIFTEGDARFFGYFEAFILVGKRFGKELNKLAFFNSKGVGLFEDLVEEGQDPSCILEPDYLKGGVAV